MVRAGRRGRDDTSFPGAVRRGRTAVPTMGPGLSSAVVFGEDASHVGEEERHMRATGSADLDSHAALHRRFVEDDRDLRGQYEATGGGALVTIKLQGWVSDWLTQHIAGVDQRLAAHLRQRVA
jgi:hemerythrin